MVAASYTLAKYYALELGARMELAIILILISALVVWIALRRRVEVEPALVERHYTHDQSRYQVDGRIDDEAEDGDSDLNDDFDDDRYSEFVTETWARSTTRLGNLQAVRITNGVRYPAFLVSISPPLGGGQGGYPYVNCIEDGRQVTFACDGRHDWEVAGLPVDSSAFRGIMLGVQPAKALGSRPPPQTPEEALSPDNDRHPARGRRFLIQYENGRGETSYRIISGVFRKQDGTFTANCHFRYGDRRTFRFDRVRQVADGDTGEEIPIDDFVLGNHRTRKAR